MDKTTETVIRKNTSLDLNDTKVIQDARSRRDKLRKEADKADAEVKELETAERNRRRDAELAKRRELRDKLELEHDLKNHPKADAIWSIAWEEGHSNGHGNVIWWYERPVELVK